MVPAATSVGMGFYCQVHLLPAMMEMLLMEMVVLQPVLLNLSFPAKMEMKHPHLHVSIKEFP